MEEDPDTPVSSKGCGAAKARRDGDMDEEPDTPVSTRGVGAAVQKPISFKEFTDSAREQTKADEAADAAAPTSAAAIASGISSTAAPTRATAAASAASPAATRPLAATDALFGGPLARSFGASLSGEPLPDWQELEQGFAGIQRLLSLQRRRNSEVEAPPPLPPPPAFAPPVLSPREAPPQALVPETLLVVDDLDDRALEQGIVDEAEGRRQPTAVCHILTNAFNTVIDEVAPGGHGSTLDPAEGGVMRVNTDAFDAVVYESMNVDEVAGSQPSPTSPRSAALNREMEDVDRRASDLA